MIRKALQLGIIWAESWIWGKFYKPSHLKNEHNASTYSIKFLKLLISLTEDTNWMMSHCKHSMNESY